jgi:hypothetical protein
MTEGRAVKALAEASLVADIRVDRDASRTGLVLRTDPPAGSQDPEVPVVTLDVALPPRLPTPGPEGELRTHDLSTFVERNADAFVGLYLDPDGTPVVVFGPGVDRSAWQDRLDAAAGGVPYRVDACGRTRDALHAVQDEVAGRGWVAGGRAVAFGVGIDPPTCTVRVESDLLSSDDVAQLAERFGTAISVDTTPGSHPVLLPG